MRRDLATSAAVAAVALVYLYRASQLPASVRQTEALGPRAYPMLIATLLLVATAALAGQALLRQRRATRDSAPAGDSPTAAPLDWRRLAAMVVATLLYLWLLGYLGFVVATIAYLLAGVLIAGGSRVPNHRQLLAPAVFSVVAAAAAYTLFAVVLNLRLPIGLLFGGTG